MSQRRGILIAFEGIDGSGKSTQARRFVEWARANTSREVLSSREPTDGPWGTKIRQARFGDRMSPSDELAAFVEDRKQHVAELINPALARGALVVVDRYYYSTAAYQGARGLDPKALLALNRAFAQKPDVVVLVDVDPKTSVERITARGQGQDSFEALDALTAVRKNFLALVEPHVAVIDGSGGEDAVFARVLSTIRERCAL